MCLELGKKSPSIYTAVLTLLNYSTAMVRSCKLFFDLRALNVPGTNCDGTWITLNCTGTNTLEAFMERRRKREKTLPLYANY